ncbi:MAG TPA: hypothetical protein VK400_05455, partial [Pyrinomonadaceae bacterium]|nr:hypothetical protein [Pyrinomonadaceae bacterium]
PEKKNTRNESTTTEQHQPETVTEIKAPQKKNQPQKSNPDAVVKTAEPKYNYYYEFTQKDFFVPHMIIEHDEGGKGKITFQKKHFDERITDPVQLSPATLEKIKALFQTLNFVDSTETYQSAERDYAHLGTMKIRRKTADGKERAVEFNWTENKDAKALADEYRKIGQQYVWQFDMSVARENQPLEAPGLMDALEIYLKRNEISDPPHMLPLLKELSNDERIPLMARNRAAKIIKQIEKPNK